MKFQDCIIIVNFYTPTVVLSSFLNTYTSDCVYDGYKKAMLSYFTLNILV